MRHLVVTDSGFGGLGLVARLEAGLRRARASARVTYVNACPDDALGYNQMASLERKRRTFASVLEAIERGLEPDEIVVACNTLSTLLAECPYRPSRPNRGIVEVGQRLVTETLLARPRQRVLVLGTATTVAARPWSVPLDGAGQAERLVYRACPGLETVISNDHGGRALPRALEEIAAEVQGRGIGAVLLGCTHYGLRAAAFARAFGEGGRDAEVLDPVRRLADELLSPMCACTRQDSAEDRGPSICFVTRYAPPMREVSTIAARLAERAPSTAAAVVGYRLDPGLFEVAPP